MRKLEIERFDTVSNTGNLITCRDDSVIDIDEYEEIFSYFGESYGSGYDRVYYSSESNCFLVDSNKNGYDGVWDNLTEAFEYLYSFIDGDYDAGNQIFDIDEDDYFAFNFSDLYLQDRDGEYRICVVVPVEDKFMVSFIMDVDTHEIYSRPDIGSAEDKYTKENISFNCAYIGSADGTAVFYVKKEIVIDKLGEDYSFEEFCNADWKDDLEWTDFGYMPKESLKDYVVKYENNFLTEKYFNCICKDENLI